MGKPEFDQTITIRIKSDQLDRINEAADRRGVNLSSFCRMSMLYFADKILGGTNESQPDAADNTSS